MYIASELALNTLTQTPASHFKHLQMLEITVKTLPYLNNNKDKGKVKLCPLFFNRAQGHIGVLREGGIAPRILDLGTRCRCVVSFTSYPLYPQGVYKN
jgi:hypothetical protein